MKKYFLLIAYHLSLITFSFAQNPLVKQWDRRYGGTGNDLLYACVQTAEGGYIIAGYSSSAIDGDKTQPSWGSSDYWIIKLDSLGNKQWDRDFGGIDGEYLYSLQQTKDKGYILGGYSFSGISGDKTQPSWGNNDFWIVKTDSLGTKEWDKDFGGIYNELLFSLQQTSDDGYILGGATDSDSSGNITQPSWGGEDYLVVKTDLLGNKEWDKRFGGTMHDVLYSLQQTNDHGYILGGYSRSGISGNKTQANWDTTNQTSDYWIVKIDSLGNKQWDKRFGGTDNDLLYSVKQTADGGYISGGISMSGINGDKTQPSWGDYDYWIVKTDALGNKQWDKVFGGIDDEDEFGNISQTDDGGYLLAGTSYSPVSGDKTENNLGQEQTWVIKTDSLGIKQWDKTIFTTGHDEIGFAIQAKEGCYVIANFTSAGVGGYKTQPNWDSTGNFTSDYWIVKFCDSTETTNIQSAIQNPQSAISIYPNPAKETLVIRDKGKGKKEIEIYDLLGRTVLHSTFNTQHSTFSIDISSLSPGIYFLKAGNEVRKFVKE